jgi:fructose-1,6-bisphosphatase/inositol monophosphatase family enzyme
VPPEVSATRGASMWAVSAALLDSNHELFGIVFAIVLSVVMVGGGGLLLFDPAAYLQIISKINRNSKFAQSYASRLERSQTGLRLVGLLSIVWGAFVGYMTLGHIFVH